MWSGKPQARPPGDQRLLNDPRLSLRPTPPQSNPHKPRISSSPDDLETPIQGHPLSQNTSRQTTPPSQSRWATPPRPAGQAIGTGKGALGHRVGRGRCAGGAPRLGPRSQLRLGLAEWSFIRWCGTRIRTMRAHFHSIWASRSEAAADRQNAFGLSIARTSGSRWHHRRLSGAGRCSAPRRRKVARIGRSVRASCGPDRHRGTCGRAHEAWYVDPDQGSDGQFSN